MGFFSWVSSCGTVGEDEPPSLIRINEGDPSNPKSSDAPPRTSPGSSRTTSTSAPPTRTTTSRPHG